jgi:predicted PurR-regulated permease PerM
MNRWTPPLWIANLLLALLLLAVLWLHLLLALFAGLAAFALHQALLNTVGRRWPRHRQTLAMALFWLVLVVLGLVVAAGIDTLDPGSPAELQRRVIELLSAGLERLRTTVPPWISVHLPDSIDAARDQAVAWVREHGAEVRTWGAETFRAAFHLVIGLVLGLLASLGASRRAVEGEAPAPTFLEGWRRGLRRLATAFTGVMGAQLRISAVNTALSALYLLAVAPMVADAVPMARLLVAFTFVAGLVPVLGNLASNAAILLASLVVSPTLAALSLAYLVAIHKLEYFLNARLVGGRIQARTYELLAALLVLESVFGLRGVIAAPIYYAWMMAGLREARWV